MVVRSDCVPPRLRGGRLAQCCRVPADLPGTRLTILFAEGSYGTCTCNSLSCRSPYCCSFSEVDSSEQVMLRRNSSPGGWIPITTWARGRQISLLGLMRDFTHTRVGRTQFSMCCRLKYRRCSQTTTNTQEQSARSSAAHLAQRRLRPIPFGSRVRCQHGCSHCRPTRTLSCTLSTFNGR